jgi:hypothetical protein
MASHRRMCGKGVAVSVAVQSAYADPSDIARFVTLGTYSSKNLPPLVRGLAFATDNSLSALAARNKKRRNEISEQLDRLDAIAQKLEREA